MTNENWLPHLPSKIELYQLALQIFFEENPHATTKPEDYELRSPEGKYYIKARSRAMAGYIRMFHVALQAYKEELEFIIEKLRKIEKPVWQPNLKALQEAIEKLEEVLDGVEH